MKSHFSSVAAALAVALAVLGSAIADEPASDEVSDSPVDRPVDDAEAGDDYYLTGAGYGGSSCGSCGGSCHGSCYSWYNYAGRCGCAPPWRVQANALFLQLSRPSGAVLVTDSFQSGGNVLLNANQFDYDYAPGWEIGVTRYLNPNWDIQFRYFGVDSWNSTAGPVTSANGGVVWFQTPIGNVETAATSTAAYTSRLHSFEVNARHPLNNRFAVLAGFRYVDLEDGNLSMVVAQTANTATADVGAANYLYGFQVGGDGLLWSSGRFCIDGIVRAGVFGNDARNFAVLTQTATPTVLASAATDDHVAFVGEVGLGGVYQVNQWCFARAGWRVLWIEGVARAANQVAVSNPTAGTATVNTDGSPLYNGFYFGFEIVR